MTTNLLPKTRALIARSRFQTELSEFASYLFAEHYTPLAVHRHLTRLDAALPRIPRTIGSRVHAASDLNAAFDLGHGSSANVHGFQAARRAYKRFLRARDRLIEPEAQDRFASLRREYDQYIIELRGLSASTRSHHAHAISDFLVRGVASRVLSALTQRDVEAFVVLRSGVTNARGHQMTRFGVRYLLRKYVAAASRSVTTLRDKRIHPHSVRYSTAVALLRPASISPRSANTTMRYARADLDLKRQALAQVFPDALAPPRGGHLLLDGRHLVGWLRRM